jgi:quercetin dioxygenase-like cupin family protein
MSADRPVSPAPKLASAVLEWSELPPKSTPVGERRDFVDGPTATFANFECHATTLNPGEAPHGAHRHADEEVIIVKDGVVEVTINGRSRLAGPGSLVFIASNDLHGLRNTSAARATYHVLRIVPRDLVTGS